MTALGAGLVPALVYWQRWCHRKVEAVSLLEGERSRRRVSVDVTVPDLPWPSPALAQAPRQHRPGRSGSLRGATRPPQTLVPLATITKASMRSLDVVDESGASVPVLGTADNGALASEFLAGLIAAESGRALTPGDRQDVAGVVFGTAPGTVDAAKALVRRLRLTQTLSEQFLVRFAEEFVLFAVLPADRVGQRTVLKYSYHWELDTPAGLGTQGHRRRFLSYPSWFLRTLAAFGFRPLPMEFQLGAPDTAASVHFEIPVPEGLHLVDLALLDGPRTVAMDSDGGTVGHIHATFSQAAGAVRAVARFEPERAGLHRFTTLSAFGVAGLLLVTWWRLPQASAEPSTPTSLLLFGPALLLTLLVRPGENVIVSSIVGPLRVTALALAGLLFLAGLGLSLRFGPAATSVAGEVLARAWATGWMLSVVCAIVLAVGSCRMNGRLRLRKGDRR